MAQDKLSDFYTDLRSDSSDADESRIDLVERLDTEDLQALRSYFFPPLESERLKQIKNKYALGYKYCGMPLTLDEFVKAMEVILGSGLYSESSTRLFHQLDTQKCGAVWWEQLLDHVIERISQRDREPAACRPLDPRVDVHHAGHCQRETIVRVVPIAGTNTFCYAVLSKYGRVGVYDGHMQLRESYTLQTANRDQGGGALGMESASGQGVPESSAARRRVGRAWVTDAVYLADARALVALTSDRCVHALDAASLCHAPLARVQGMRNVPLCAAYACARSMGAPSLLLLGDDRGGVVAMRFRQPHVALFRKKHPDRLDKYYWTEIQDQANWVTVSEEADVHADAVRQVAYCPENDTVISCSHDPNATVVVRHLGARRSPYIFRIARGVRCFHLERSLKLLATGSSDGVVRLWNPVVTKQPAASLFGHKVAVVDVQLVRKLAAALSVSADGVVKVWDIEDHCCLQSLSLGLTLSASKTIDFGTRALYPGPPSQSDTRAADPARDPTSLEWPCDEKNGQGNGRSGRTLRVLVAYCSQLAVLRLTVPGRVMSTLGGNSVGSGDNALENNVTNSTSMSSTGVSGSAGDRAGTTDALPPTAVKTEENRGRRGGGVSQERSPSPPPPPARERPPCVPAPWRAAEEHIRLTPDGASTAFSDQESSPPPSPVRERVCVPGGPPVALRSPPSSSAGLTAAAAAVADAVLPMAAARAAAAAAAATAGGVPADMNARRAAHERRAREMRWLVERCAPHLALQLHDLQEVRFSRPLPPTTRMRERNLEPSEASTAALGKALGGGGGGGAGGGGGVGGAGAGGGGGAGVGAVSPASSSGTSSNRSSGRGGARAAGYTRSSTGRK